jgi:hypothetical protein
MLWIAIGVIVPVAVLALVIWSGHRMLRDGSGGGGAMSDGLGNFIDVFDPGRARADREIEAEKHSGPVIPSPDDDKDLAVKLDLNSGTARVRHRSPDDPAT